MTRAISEAEPLVVECTGWMAPPEIHIDRIWFASETHHTLGLVVVTACFGYFEKREMREALLPLASELQFADLRRLELAVSRERMMVQRRYAPRAATPMSATELADRLGVHPDTMTPWLKACELSKGKGQGVLLTGENQVRVCQEAIAKSRSEDVRAIAKEHIQSLS